MTVQSATWKDAEQTAVEAVIDGRTFSYVPVKAGNREWDKVSEWIDAGNAVASNPALVTAARHIKLEALKREAESRLTALSYDGRAFDVSGGLEDLVHKWHSGAKEFGALWGGGSWIHVTDDPSTPYDLATHTDCKTWAMALFALAALVHNARDTHELALRALTTVAAVDAYDATAGWP